MSREMAEPRHVLLSKPTYSTTELGHILEAYVGHVPGRQKLHVWLHTARDRGYFPNARRERAYIQNSPWVLPGVDVEGYLRATYPQGVLPHLVNELDLSF